MPAGDLQPTSLLLDEGAWADEPARLAQQLGHNVEQDGSGRWTCVGCHRAVLRCGTNIYGSAVEEHCDVPLATWEGHTNDIGDWCPWSGAPITDEDDDRCPAGCRDSEVDGG